MSSQTAETPISYADFLEYLERARNVVVVGPVATGLRVWILLRGVWKAFRITDQFGGSFLMDNPASSLAIAKVGTATPGTLTPCLGVKFPASSSVVITATSIVFSAQIPLNSATATQLDSSGVGVSNLLIKNLDAVNVAYIGNSGVTPASGYPLEVLGTSDDSVWLRNVSPSTLYGISAAGTPTVALLAY